MQAVAELVEERFDLVVRQQRGLVGVGLVKLHTSAASGHRHRAVAPDLVRVPAPTGRRGRICWGGDAGRCRTQPMTCCADCLSQTS